MIFRVVVTGYNCERWASLCLLSLQSAAIGYEAFYYVVNDGSSDDTANKIREAIRGELIEPRVTLINNETNRGAAFSRWVAIEEIRKVADDLDVVLFIDLDDFVLPRIFDVIAAAYAGGARLTYGNWSDLATREVNLLYTYPEGSLEDGSFINLPFWVTAPRSCLWSYVSKLVEGDFIFEGDWIANCTDVALMVKLIVLLEGVGVVPISEPLYMYRRGTGINTSERYGYEDKIRIAELIKNRFT